MRVRVSQSVCACVRVCVCAKGTYVYITCEKGLYVYAICEEWVLEMCGKECGKECA